MKTTIIFETKVISDKLYQELFVTAVRASLYLSPKVWDVITKKLKKASFYLQFKKVIQEIDTRKLPVQTSKPYVSGVEFL